MENTSQCPLQKKEELSNHDPKPGHQDLSEDDYYDCEYQKWLNEGDLQNLRYLSEESRWC